MPINLVRGNKGKIVTFTIKDADGSAVNLAGCTINFHLYNLDTNIQVNAADDDCVILVAADGTCTYTWKVTDLATAGDFKGEIEVIFADTSEDTMYGTFDIKIRDHLKTAAP